MAISLLPNEKDVRDALGGLLFRDITLSPGEPVVPSPTDPVSIAVYVDDSLGTAAVIVTDLSLSAFAGAAIGLVPVGGAEACIEDRELPTSIKENLDEVLNVLASLFNAEGQPHVKLYATYGLGEAPPNDISAILRAFGRRLDLGVDVAGYGKGRISIVLA
ncbi:hypothetical protein [Motilibacter aurantiacus]|uniref:hypothetical protein n=1 Tax=Motilibacter aurantiacus TaxID=2714955 RepID=UPI0014084AF1|nr:hypothetical protein [Motilibacter aurantiacus]NHC46268.1 hypothetical protein [Motilibacter aurantiacus]